MATTKEIGLLRQSAAALRAQGNDEAATRVERAIRDLACEQLPGHLRDYLESARSDDDPDADCDRPPPDGDRHGPSSAA